VEKRSPPEFVVLIFENIVRGEPWANSMTLDVDEKWISPHLKFVQDPLWGCVYLPPNDNPFIMSAWIAHESGHFPYLAKHPFPKVRAIFEDTIRSKRTPAILQALVRKIYYLVFWKQRMREEIEAHKEEIRLLDKIGCPLQAIRFADEVLDKIKRPMPYCGRVERIFGRRLQEAQDELTRQAEKVSKEEVN
jgi:hypothetical protein